MERVTCPVCAHEFFPSLKDALLSVMTFDGWEARKDFLPTLIEGVGHVSVVHVSVPERDNHGEADGPTYMVFEINYESEKSYHRLSGYYDSYDGYRWDGPLVPTEKRTRTIEEWV